MFVPFLKRAPFIRIMVPMAIGIVFQLYIPLSAAVWLTALGLQWLLVLCIARAPLSVVFNLRWLRGLALQLILCCLGALLVHWKDINYSRHVLKQGDQLLVTVEEPVQRKKKTFKTKVMVMAVVRGDKVLRGKERLLLYLEADSLAAALQYGDRLLLYNRVAPIRYSGNPGTFNYQQYCLSKGIYRQAYLRAGEWKRLPGNHKQGILVRTRDYCLRMLRLHIGEKEAGLAAALLIGYRYDLDPEIMQDYMRTGIVHIIAISGMHLALIYGSLLWLMKRCPPYWQMESLKGILVLLILWSFTLLTGGGASVWRATVMFTFLAAGKYFLQRHTNEYNTLAASAFVLLCYDPYLLRDVGFQLSYLAVLSIMICYRPLYLLWQIPNRWLNKLWEAIALTLAAQLLTFPVCLYYFHQFPVYFLPANLLAVPLSTIILYGEIILLLCGVHWIGMVLQKGIMLLNFLTSWIGHWPGALISDIPANLYDTVCVYICIAGVLSFCLHRWRGGLIMASCAGLLWSVGIMVDNLGRQQQRKIVIYHIPKHTGISIIWGKKVLFAGDSILVRTPDLYRQYLQPAFLFYGIKDCSISPARFLCAGNTRLVIVDSALPGQCATEKFRTDYLLLSHDPHVDIRQLEALFDVGCYIFDASCSQKYIQQWKSDCYALTLRFFSVPDHGAYVVNF